MASLSLTSPAALKTEAHRRKRYLAGIVGRKVAYRGSSLLLVLDALAAIGFAAGLAGGVAAIANHAALLLWLGLLLFAGTIRAALLLLSARVGAALARDAKRSLRARIVSVSMRRPPGTATTGQTLTTIVDEVEALDGYIARFLPARAAAGAAPMLILIATAVASPIAAGILVATLIPFIAAMILAGGAAADESRRQFAAMSRLSAIFLDRVRALPVILAFQTEESQASVIGRAAKDVARRTLRVLAVAFLSSGALEFFAALSVALVAVYAGFNLLGLLPFHVSETLDLRSAFFILALAPEFYAPLRRLAAAYHDKQAAETAAERLRAIEGETPNEPFASPIFLAAPPEIRFHSVSITYPDCVAAAVSAFSLDVRRGETVALCGPSGCGKTSLLHSLLGLAPISSGHVTIDGEDLPSLGGVSAAWSGQTPLILAGTLAENIALGRPHATRAEIEQAAVAAGLAPTLAARGGVGAQVDERGGGLSGGERRRIGLARAVLSDAPLLLLDEPTAHLDDQAERELIQTIARIAKGRTVLMGTHSPALLKIADRVIVMELTA